MIFDFANARYNNVLVKLTSECNLECKYCYVKPHQNQAQFMSEKVLSAIFNKYSAYAEKLEDDRRFMYYIWHGGEPLSCGLDYFKRLIEIQRIFDDRNYIVYNGVQTNGTLLDKTWVKFLKENNFAIGLSLDGPRLIQEMFRAGKNGKDSFASVERSIKLLHDEGLLFSVIAVISNESAPYWKDIYDYLSSLDVRYVDFLPCYNGHDGMFLTPENYETFYLSMVKHWLDNDKNVDIRFFSDISNKIRNDCHGASLGCEVMGQCGEVQYITENGDLFPCTVLPVDDRMKMGNIVKDDLEACLSSENYQAFQRTFNVDSECETCEYFKVCKGGCAARRLYPPTTLNNTASRDIYCKGRQKIIDQLKYHQEVQVEKH